jgi:hypothetical protein
MLCCAVLCCAVLCCECVQVMAKLQAEAQGVKGFIVSALLSASYAHIEARRVVMGHSLLHATQPPSAVQQLVAAATVAATALLYALAQKLVFSKVSPCPACQGSAAWGYLSVVAPDRA